MKEQLVVWLKPFAECCYRWATHVSPAAALVIYLLVLGALALWVMTLKAERPSLDDDSRGPALVHDLRVWAVTILVLQMVIYVVFR